VDRTILKWHVAWIEEGGERKTSKGYDSREEAKSKMKELQECGFKAWILPLFIDV
jgi:hypothetical protein